MNLTSGKELMSEVFLRATLPLGPHTTSFGEWFDMGKAPEGVVEKAAEVLRPEFSDLNFQPNWVNEKENHLQLWITFPIKEEWAIVLTGIRDFLAKTSCFFSLIHHHWFYSFFAPILICIIKLHSMYLWKCLIFFWDKCGNVYWSK